MYYNVKDYGAIGDGVTNDTKAIQKAVDKCFENGGGKIIFPNGRYLSGRIVLKSNMTVEICEGATVIASADMENDYPQLSDDAADTSFYSAFKKRGIEVNDSRIYKLAVFYACGAENIAITGKGTIYGNYKNMLIKTVAEEGIVPRWINYIDDIRTIYDRPDDDLRYKRTTLLFFQNCRRIILDGVNYNDAPMYTIQFRSSSEIKIKGIRIDNYLGIGNSDGIHFSSCFNVSISDCSLKCGDDCIAIDGNDMKDSFGYSISNCIFETRNNCFRLYTNLKTGEEERNAVKGTKVSDISINNCTVIDASSFAFIHGDEGTVERINISSIVGNIKRLGTVFLIACHEGKVKDIILDKLNFESNGIGYIYSNMDDGIENIKLIDSSFSITPKTKLYGNGFDMLTFKEMGYENNGKLPAYSLSHYAPYFLQIKRASDVLISRVNIKWLEGDISDIEEMKTGYKKYICIGRPEPWEINNSWPSIHVSYCKKIDIIDTKCEAFNSFESAIYKINNIEN